MKPSCWIFTLLTAAAVAGAVELPSIFGDEMVLQRDRAIPIWGSGAPGESVTVEFSGRNASTRVDENGRWKITLAPLPASGENRNLSVKGNNTITLKNVLVGDVWLCVGQSNMEFGLRHIEAGKEIAAAADNSQIRLFKVPKVWSRTPAATVDASWKPCNANNAGGFSAVGYLVGKELERTLRVPIGLIDISWGGCRVEAMSALDSFDAVAPGWLRDEVHKQVTEMNAKPDAELRKDKQRLPTVLFHAMAQPLAPFAVRGMLWYQGEDNHWEGAVYTDKMRVMIHSWRNAFQNPALPIYLVQLPPWQYGDEDPGRIPEFWLAQQRFAEQDPHAGFIVATDCGDPADIHPREKRPLAERLARLVLYREYGNGDDTALAPTFQSASREGSTMRITFRHPNGLKTRDGQPPMFLEVAGTDGVFHPATAKLINDELLVSSPQVSEPQQVRFGWHKLANPNLVNRAGVPVAPFHSAK